MSSVHRGMHGARRRGCRDERMNSDIVGMRLREKFELLFHPLSLRAIRGMLSAKAQ